MSRANQSAINRRAGGQQQGPPQMQQRQTVGISSQQMMQQQSRGPPQINQANSPYHQPGQGPMKSFGYQEPYQEPMPPQPPKKGKISIADAIALTTLRLGRVEQIIDKWQHDGHPARGDLNHDSSVSTEPVIDQSVLMSIISRIENLEKRPVAAPVSTPQAIDTRQFDDKLESLKQEIGLLKKSMSNITQEITQIKENAMKLQMFTMETNQKLIGAVINQPTMQSQPFQRLVTPIYENLGNSVDLNEVTVDNTSIIDENNVEVSMDLKDFIKNELMSEPVLEG